MIKPIPPPGESDEIQTLRAPRFITRISDTMSDIGPLASIPRNSLPVSDTMSAMPLSARRSGLRSVDSVNGALPAMRNQKKRAVDDNETTSSLQKRYNNPDINVILATLQKQRELKPTREFSQAQQKEKNKKKYHSAKYLPRRKKTRDHCMANRLKKGLKEQGEEQREGISWLAYDKRHKQDDSKDISFMKHIRSKMVDNDNRRLHGQNKLFQHSIQELKDDLKYAEMTRNKLDKIQQMNAQLMLEAHVIRRTTNHHSDKEFQTVVNERDLAQNSLAERSSEYRKISKAFEQTTEQHTRLTTEHQTLQKQHSTLTKSNRMLKMRFAMKEAKLEKTKIELTEATEAVTKQEDKIKELSRSQQLHLKNSRESESQIHDQREKIEQLITEVAALKTLKENHSNSIKRLEMTNLGLVSSCEKYHTDLTKQQEITKKLKLLKGVFSKEAVALIEASKYNQFKVDELKQTLDHEKVEHHKTRNQLKEVKLDYEQVHEQYQTSEEELDRQRTMSSQLMKQVEKTRILVTALNEQKSLDENNRRLLIGEIKDLKKELHDKIEENEVLASRYNQAKQNLTTTQISFESKLAQSQSQLKTLNQTMSILQTINNADKGKFAEDVDKQNKLQELTAIHLRESEDTIKAKQAEITRLVSENEDWKNKYELITILAQSRKKEIEDMDEDLKAALKDKEEEYQEEIIFKNERIEQEILKNEKIQLELLQNNAKHDEALNEVRQLKEQIASMQTFKTDTVADHEPTETEAIDNT